MVKKSILKDAIREIKKTRKRFLSILLIITLGVGFYVGLKSTSLDMENTAKKYYKDTNLMDLKLISSAGFNDEDYEKLKAISDVKGVMLVKSLDANVSVDDKDYVIKVNSINSNRSKKNDDYLNRLVLTNGKYPSTVNEGLVEEKFLSDNNLKIGDLVTLEPEDNSSLRAKKIKIVGTVRNSYYSSSDRGTSTLGNGKIDYFMYVDEKDFSNDYYSEAYVTLKDANKYDTYSNEYEKYVEKIKPDVLSVVSESTKVKQEEQVKQLQNSISFLESDLNELYSSNLPSEDLNSSIKNVTNKLNEAKENLEKLQNPSTYVLTRNETSSFYEYKLETQRIENIARVFPAIFFLVAALVSLTAMTRIVEEERIQVGTLRAIGYSKFDVVFKYVLYAFLSSFIGSILGSLLFYKFIPLIVAMCYGMFYEMPRLITSFQINHVLFASACAVLSTILATILVFLKDTLLVPAELMRPEAPKPGKRVLLERINFIWKRLNFSNKVTFRNVFRYKKRLLMTIIGICGCTALLLTAFGLRDSVNGVIKNQFDKINKYDMMVNVNPNISKENLNELKNTLDQNKNIDETLLVSQQTVNIKHGDKHESSYLIIPSDNKKIDDFIGLQVRKSKAKLNLNEDGIIVSEKLSELLNIKKNDTITIVLNDKEYKVKVNGITENYVDHYVYMTNSLYEKITDKNTSYNVILTNNKKLSEKEEQALSKDVMSQKYVTSCTLSSLVKETYKDSISTLTYVTLILIVAAAALAFVVLYNLSSINISERRRELATIKVLGFYDNEVTSYVNKETIILTVIGALVGLLMGSFLTYYVVKACETNQFMFSFDISFLSYLLSLLITIIFLIIVGMFMHKELQKLDMIEALKSVE